MKSRTLAVAIGIATAAMNATAQTTNCPDTIPPVTATTAKAVCDGDVCTVTIDWAKPPLKHTLRIESTDAKDSRITSKTQIVIDNRHFNFLRYNLQFEVKEKTVDTYVLLEKLWRQIFVLAGTPGALVRPSEFVTELVKWRSALATADDHLTKYLSDSAPKSTGLSDEDLRAICMERVAVQEALEDLRTKRDSVIRELKASDRMEDIAAFDQVDHAYSDFRTREEAFIEAERMTREGFRKMIPAKDVGRMVTVTLKPASVNAAAEEQPVVVEYFVQSPFPVTYHVGVIYSRIADMKFQTVRTLSGADLFAQIKDDKDIAALSAFLSTPLTHRGNESFLFSIGTDFTDPGKRLYAGVSYPVWKGLITVGAASGAVSEGGNKVIDQIVDHAGNLLGTRELFDTVRSRRKWSGVFAITFKPF